MEPITEAEARQFFAGAMVAHIGVVSNGDPYVSPVSYVLDGNRVLFRTKPGKRFEGLIANPRVSIEASRFDEETGDWISVIVQGRAVERTDSATTNQTVELLYDKYVKYMGSPLSRSGFQAMATFPHVVEVSIDEITGMVSGRGFSHQTRPGRL
jgi:nitroimidazol reductase NimA-like FMN-containing flavoprotein (pyridoxamine 5'-phosphate oxidase superfamily)